MDDPNLHQNQETVPDPDPDPEPEPVRSRWTPKPEQILILESIFNSGMVNPPKEETVRIRKLLEKFGTVGDANVFYWFQNRRSRSRRRQRQMQAGLANTQSRSSSAANFQFSTGATSGGSSTGGGASYGLYGCNSNSYSSPYSGSYMNYSYSGCYSSGATSSSSSSSSSSSPGFAGEEMGGGTGAGGEDLFAISRQMGLSESQYGSVSGANSSEWQYQSAGSGSGSGSGTTISVFINGVAMEVPRGAINLRTAFGQDVLLLSSSGDVLPVNDYGILMQGLQMGQTYFAVPRST